MKRFHLMVQLLPLSMLFHLPALAQAQILSATVPQLISFSGTLKGLTVPQLGFVGVTFSLYEEQEGGVALWTETQNVQPDEQGRYTVMLGAMQQGGLPLALFTAGKARWLSVKPQLPEIGDQPRVLLVGVPYALKAADADTLGGLPASSFVQVNSLVPAVSGARTESTSAGQQQFTSSAQPDAACTGLSSDGTAAPNQVAKFTAPCTLEPSTIVESSGRVGIGTKVPAGALDVKGNAFVRGVFQLPATGTATANGGFNSQPLDLLGSAFNSGTGTAVNQHFRWQAEPVGNNTAAPTGSLNLLFGTGGAQTARTGLSISAGGVISFTPNQTFPASTFTGSETVEGNVSASGQLISTVSQGTAPLQVSSTTLVPNLNAGFLGGLPASIFANLSAPNVFSAGQSFLGTVGIGTTTPADLLDIAGNTRISATGRIGFATTASQVGFNRNPNTGGIYDNTSNAFQLGQAGPNQPFSIGQWGADGSFLATALSILPNTDVALALAGGNVGIGTSTPSDLLDIAGETHISAAGRIGFSTDASQIGFNRNPNTGAIYDNTSNAYQFGQTGANQPFSLSQWAPSGTLVGTPLSILPNDNIIFVQDVGNVGIGTTSPAARLDVSGNIRCQSGGIIFPDGSVQASAEAVGPAGPQGPRGPQGPTGPVGPPGYQGCYCSYTCVNGYSSSAGHAASLTDCNSAAYSLCSADGGLKTFTCN